MTDSDIKETGVVKWFNSRKGFGFISADEKDYFVHFSGIISDGFKELQEFDQVEFRIQEDEKGQKAVDVEVVD